LTDWAPPDKQVCANKASLVIDTFGLVALADLIACLDVANPELTDESPSDSIGQTCDSVR